MILIEVKERERIIRLGKFLNEEFEGTFSDNDNFYNKMGYKFTFRIFLGWTYSCGYEKDIRKRWGSRCWSGFY